MAEARAFVDPVPTSPGSFRYHALFRELLRAQLAYERPGEVAALRRQAAEWLAQARAGGRGGSAGGRRGGLAGRLPVRRRRPGHRPAAAGRRGRRDGPGVRGPAAGHTGGGGGPAPRRDGHDQVRRRRLRRARGRGPPAGERRARPPVLAGAARSRAARADPGAQPRRRGGRADRGRRDGAGDPGPGPDPRLDAPGAQRAAAVEPGRTAVRRLVWLHEARRGDHRRHRCGTTGRLRAASVQLPRPPGTDPGAARASCGPLPRLPTAPWLRCAGPISASPTGRRRWRWRSRGFGWSTTTWTPRATTPRRAERSAGLALDPGPRAVLALVQARLLHAEHRPESAREVVRRAGADLAPGPVAARPDALRGGGSRPGRRAGRRSRTAAGAAERAGRAGHLADPGPGRTGRRPARDDRPVPSGGPGDRRAVAHPDRRLAAGDLPAAVAAGTATSPGRAGALAAAGRAGDAAAAVRRGSPAGPRPAAAEPRAGRGAPVDARPAGRGRASRRPRELRSRLAGPIRRCSSRC